MAKGPAREMLLIIAVVVILVLAAPAEVAPEEAAPVATTTTDTVAVEQVATCEKVAEEWSHAADVVGATIVCSTPEVAEFFGVPGAVGWFRNVDRTIYVLDDLTETYTHQVIAHEWAHAWDWDLGQSTDLGGYYSDHLEMGIEEYATSMTQWLGMWPEEEVPYWTDAEVVTMAAEGRYPSTDAIRFLPKP